MDGLGPMRDGVAGVERLADEDRVESDDLMATGQERRTIAVGSPEPVADAALPRGCATTVSRPDG